MEYTGVTLVLNRYNDALVTTQGVSSPVEWSNTIASDPTYSPLNTALITYY